MNYDKSYIELRIASLQRNPTENTRLIKKWQRILRRIESK